MTTSTSLTRFRYTGLSANIAQARDGSGAVQWNLVRGSTGNARMDFAPGGGGQRYFGVNAHGDVTWTASSSGVVSSTLRYDPWGVPGATSGAAMPDFRFQGSWFDGASGLSWAVNRWYIPALGRFASEDPLLGVPTSPADRHRYAYGGGDPVDRADVDGRFWYKVHSGESLYGLAYRFYGTSAGTSSLIRGNPGYPVTQVRLSYSTQPISAGQCLWIPYVNQSNACLPFGAARTDWTYSSALYTRYRNVLQYSWLRMINESKDGAGGVGTWSDIPLIGQALDIVLLYDFANLVEAGHPWDLKVGLRALYGEDLPFHNAVEGDAAPESLYYDVWGNIHYGFVGRGHGIPAETLRWGNVHYGGANTLSDRESVELGMRLWDTYHRSLTSATLSASVRALLPTYRGDYLYDPNEIEERLHG